MKEEVILEYLTQNSQSDQSEGCSQREQATDCSRLLRKPPRFQGSLGKFRGVWYGHPYKAVQAVPSKPRPRLTSTRPSKTVTKEKLLWGIMEMDQTVERIREERDRLEHAVKSQSM
ncbi:hypothetical protein F2Q68_00015130 [Brassica cretica]|uniref:Uncharacterized protein n=1 Tax=Brassica cretica TaxID=69181 RepID=A0A8S9HH77_BRACR|nr:hypothetical protein F2Q68_00015130 [Brassica cretica]